MNREDIVYLSVLISSFLLAIPLTWKIWPSFKKKLNKSYLGRSLLNMHSLHGKFACLLHGLIWITICIIMLVGYEVLK